MGRRVADEVSDSMVEQTDELCDRFENAWEAGNRPRLENYLGKVPRDKRISLLRELLDIEIFQRRKLGEKPQANDYRQRFPKLPAQWIQSVIDKSSPPPSTATCIETLEEFTRLLDSSGLMAAEKFETWVQAQDETDRPTDAGSAAKALIANKKLTQFQADRILQGEAEGLMMDDYELLNFLGSGAMGDVYRGRHRIMNRIVAIKTLKKEIASKPEAVERFHREVRVASRLGQHENIITAYDARESQGVHYLVMEFVDGQDLGDLMKQNGPLPMDQAVDYIVQAARGLAVAHQNDIIHRDIKPANLMLSKQGVVKVSDLGLARENSAVTPSDQTDTGTVGGDMTQTGVIMGTFAFMAPEQGIDPRSVDHRADIYSLGCTLFYMLTGRAVYEGTTPMETMLSHANSPIPSLQEALPNSPLALEEAVCRMIAKRADGRYQSMDEVIDALTAIDLSAVDVAPAVVGATDDSAAFLTAPTIDLPATELEADSLLDIEEAAVAQPLATLAPVNGSSRPSGGNNRKPMAIGAGIAVLLLIALFVWSPWSGDSGGDEPNRSGNGKGNPPATKPRVVMIVPTEDTYDNDYFPVRRILTRNGIEVITASASDGDLTSHGQKTLRADTKTNQLQANDYDAVVFVGKYSEGTEVPFSPPTRFIQGMVDENKWVTAMCGGTRVLAAGDVLRGQKAADGEYVKGKEGYGGRGIKWVTKADGASPIVSGNFITGGNGTLPNAESFATKLASILIDGIKPEKK